MPDPLALLRVLPILAPALLLAGCRSRPDPQDPPDAVVVVLPRAEPLPEPRKGMAWIPAGTFVSGTPIDRVPRVPDVEPPGIPVSLNGFYIDLYPFPNEPGAIPTTSVSREEAGDRCKDLGKRLCTELEWERACKGPDSLVYEYGNTYRAESCASGVSGPILPSGSHVACRSKFGVHDLHGGPAEWTASDWGRSEPRPLVTLRGGTGSPGDIVGRCAHATASRPDLKRPNIGFRCCAGPANDAVVELEVSRSDDSLVFLRFDSALADSLARTVPAADLARVAGAPFVVDRIWRWYPAGNEELLVAAGCARAGRAAVCGVAVSRPPADDPRPLAFASSAGWVPLLRADDDRRVLWLHGVVDRGQFRRRIEYQWGRIGVGDPDRAGEPKKKKRKS